MVREAVILAGGSGTRLGSVVKDVPKPMAEVSGRPFLEYLLDYIIGQDINRVILALGFKHQVIKKHFGESYKGLELIYSVEKDPLDTGGAIKKALDLVAEDDVLILNGDTYCDVSLARLYEFHRLKESVLSLALKRLRDFSRYGTVELDGSGRIVGFKEKRYRREGMINCGIYFMRGSFLRKLGLPAKFSFEKDFLEKYFTSFPFYGLTFDDCSFIDIGTPEDYALAQMEVKKRAERLFASGAAH